MSLVRVSPMRELQHVQDMMNRVFGDTVSRFFGDSDTTFPGGDWTPPVDIHETDSDLVFTCELPGFEKDQVNITVNEGRLVLSGERTEEKVEKKDRKYHHVERWTGSFYRSFLLPTTVDTGAVSANLKNGLLTVTLPKKAEAKPRQIAVKVQ
jgi:HSP20 family protein